MSQRAWGLFVAGCVALFLLEAVLGISLWSELRSSGERLLPAGALTVGGALGFLLALVALTKLRRSEARDSQHLREMERAAEQMRRLSQMLVRTQENEQKTISRELHDEIGQTLTALTIELDSLADAERLHWGEVPPQIVAARQLADTTLQTVRQMARALRPAVLDDLGLEPAVRWQTREFERRTAVPVALEVAGTLDGLPESHRTCLYRVIQEALTNCARHAKAQAIRVGMQANAESVVLTVEDDGVGFDSHQNGSDGIGLLGMSERVAELGGEVAISSRPGKGTMIRVEVPLQGRTRG